MDILKSEYLQIALAFSSALILFLYATKTLGKEFQELASTKFRNIIVKLVRNKYSGTLFGTVLTALIQSSTAVSVITIMLVNMGIIPFYNSLGIILGSNIGTTITALLVLVDSTILAPSLMIIGLLLGIIGKKMKIISKPVFHIGFLLFSLSLLSSTIEPLKSSPVVISLFANISSPLVAYLVSALFTAIIHSSSVTTGIIVVLAQSGLVPIEVAIPMILGANLGTTFTSLIISAKLNLFAKRVAMADFLFNFFGTTVFMLLLSPFLSTIQSLSLDPGTQTALAHLLFNFITALFFFLFLSSFEKLIGYIVKGEEEEILLKTKHLKNNFRGKPKKRINNIKMEISYSIEITIKLYQKALVLYHSPTSNLEMEIAKYETLNDYLDSEITKAIVELSKNKLSPKNAYSTISLIKISNTIEELGDIGKDLSEVFLRMHKLGISRSEVDIKKLTAIHNKLIELFQSIQKNIINTSEKRLLLIKEKEEEISSMIREQFSKHVLRLQQEEKYNGTIFVDAISTIESAVFELRSIRKIMYKQIKEYGN